MKKSIIIGTAGHIDHGKTALVKAITGVDTDRLPEEKVRGITIDLGFAHTSLNDTDVSFIDVPGHERFVKNMLAGIGGIDLLMLVVAADESVMPQTREHFDISRLLDIPAGIVVITKKDLVDEETLELVESELKELVQDTFLQDAPVFAVSSKTGDGLERLKAGLASCIALLNQRKDDGIFRLPVDRVFTLKGHGTVVTGTLISGRINRDSQVEILPSRIRTRVRSIHAHNQKVDEAAAGQRTALNLQGLDKNQIQRGVVLTEPDFFTGTSLLDVKIRLLQSSRPLLHNGIVRFHHQAMDVLARVTLLGRENLQPGDSAFAQLRLQKPVFGLYGDRFILRRHSPLITIGGGIILDHMPGRRTSQNDSAALQRLKRLEKATLKERLSIIMSLRGMLGADEAFLRAKMALRAEQIVALDCEDVVLLRRQPLLLISRNAGNDFIDTLETTLRAFHEKNPLHPGISKEQLRTSVFSHVLPDVYQSLLDRAAESRRIQIDKDVISVYGRKVSLSGQEETIRKKIEESLLRAGLEFPGLEKLSVSMKERPQEIQKILYVLVREGKVVKVAEDYFIHHESWETLKQKIRNLKSSRKTFSVPDFKTLFGVTRKYAIPLLEQLDRGGVTRRSGKERIIL